MRLHHSLLNACLLTILTSLIFDNKLPASPLPDPIQYDINYESDLQAALQAKAEGRLEDPAYRRVLAADLHNMDGIRRNPLDQGNDVCPAAVIPVLPFIDNGSTGGMANDYFECSNGPDVIYSYTAVFSGTHIISLCGSNYDTKLELRTDGVCPGASQLTCNDDFCGVQSQITAELTAGQEYFIIIGGFDGGAGSYVLTMTGPQQRLPNDECSGAIALPPPSPDFPTFLNGSTAGSIISCGDVCDHPSNSGDVFYSVTLASCRRIAISLRGGDMHLSVFQGLDQCCGEHLLCNDDDANFSPLPPWDVPTQHAGGLNSFVEGEIGPGTYFIRVGRRNVGAGPFNLSLYDDGACPAQATCLTFPFTEDFRLGPLFVGQTAASSVPVVNTSGGVLQVMAASDAPFLIVPFSGPFIVQPAETLHVAVNFTAPARGYTDCGLILSAGTCPDFVAPLTVLGEPNPNIPGAPVLTAGANCGGVALQIDVSGNLPDVEYSIAVSLNNFATTNYLQFDGSLGNTPRWTTSGEWEELLSDGIAGLLPGQVFSAKAQARSRELTSSVGPVSHLMLPNCPVVPAPAGLVMSRNGSDVLLRWQPVLFDASGILPVVDARYRVQSCATPDGDFTNVIDVDSSYVVLSNELLSATRKFYRVIALSNLGPLSPSLRLTEPEPGKLLTGNFVAAAMDAGAGAFSNEVTAVFQAYVGGVWQNISQDNRPQWIEGNGIWSSMVHGDSLPSGLCSLRVVESGPFGIVTASHAVIINRQPRAQTNVTFSAGTALLDGTPSSDADGPLTSFVWTLPDGRHLYGPSVTVPTHGGDTTKATLEVTDVMGVNQFTNFGWVCDPFNTCFMIGIQCGCDSMKIFDSGKIRGKSKSFPGSHVIDDHDSTTKDDDQLLGPLALPAPNPPVNRDLAVASYNFEAKAYVKFKVMNPSQSCTHMQQFQLDEKCNGVRFDPDTMYGVNGWNHAIGGATWADDDYNTDGNTNIFHFEGGANPEMDWLDGPMRTQRVKTLKACAGISYECIFCDVVDGPLGCCRCKYKVTWTIGANGQLTAAPALDKTGAGLGCIHSTAGNCGC